MCVKLCIALAIPNDSTMGLVMLFFHGTVCTVTDLVERVSQRVLQREVLRLQRGVVALQLLQTGVHDVQDGALNGPHGRCQRHVKLHHFWLVPVQRRVHRRLESAASRGLRRRGKTVRGFSLVQ